MNLAVINTIVNTRDLIEQRDFLLHQIKLAQSDYYLANPTGTLYFRLNGDDLVNENERHEYLNSFELQKKIVFFPVSDADRSLVAGDGGH